MAYCDYEFYSEIYCGNVVPQEEFLNLAIRATAHLKAYVEDLEDEEICDEVKFCMCEICDLLYTADLHSGIEYERNDGYWVSYESELNTSKRIESCVKTWLSSSGLLYRGREFI